MYYHYSKLLHTSLFSVIIVFFVTNTATAQRLHYQTGKSFISIDYQQQTYKGINRYMTFHDHDPNVVINGTYHQHLYYFPFDPATEQFTTVQINGQYYLNRRTAVQITIPYVNNYRISDKDIANNKARGLGDISLGGYYYLYDSHLFQVNPTKRHLLTFGGWLHIPSGKFANFDVLNELEPHMQVGKGSYRAQLIASYQFQKQQSTIQISTAYQYSLPNAYEYIFGRELLVGTSYTYTAQLKKITIEPLLGFFLKHNTPDLMQNRPTAEDTGGWNCQLNTGFKLQWQQVFMKIQYDFPTLQEINGLQPKWKRSFQVEVGLELNRNKQTQ